MGCTQARVSIVHKFAVQNIDNTEEDESALIYFTTSYPNGLSLLDLPIKGLIQVNLVHFIMTKSKWGKGTSTYGK